MRSRAVWYWLMTAGVLILTVAGYVGYEVYPRFGLPRAEGAGLLLLATGAGIASFFSPCSFPLLATLLARATGVEARVARRPQSAGRALTFAAGLSIGVSTFLLLSGLIIAFGGQALLSGITFTSPAGLTIRFIVGFLLIILGLIQTGVLPNYFHMLEHAATPLMQTQARYRRRSPFLGFTILGFGYVFAGLGWTGPILAGLAAHAFAIGGFWAALVAFGNAALVIVLLMFVLAFAIATAQEELAGALRAHVADVKRWGGWILIAVGIWLITLTVFAGLFAGIFPV